MATPAGFDGGREASLPVFLGAAVFFCYLLCEGCAGLGLTGGAIWKLIGSSDGVMRLTGSWSRVSGVPSCLGLFLGPLSGPDCYCYGGCTLGLLLRTIGLNCGPSEVLVRSFERLTSLLLLAPATSRVFLRLLAMANYTVPWLREPGDSAFDSTARPTVSGSSWARGVKLVNSSALVTNCGRRTGDIPTVV